jgi:hypothetical protein
MGFFDHIQKNGGPSAKPKAKVVKQTVVTKTVLKTPLLKERSKPAERDIRSIVSKPKPSHNSESKSRERIAVNRKRPGAAKTAVFSSSEDDSSEEETDHPAKRARRSTSVLSEDLDRDIAISEKVDKPDNLTYVHALKITASEKSYQPAFGRDIAQEIELQYPSQTDPER